MLYLNLDLCELTIDSLPNITAEIVVLTNWVTRACTPDKNTTKNVSNASNCEFGKLLLI